MRIVASIIILFNCASSIAQPGIPPIGMWREHMPYNSVIDLASDGDKVYAATPYSLFSVTINDHSIERMSRVTGLSETGISAISLDEVSRKLFVAYENSNIDVIHRADIINLPDIKRDDVVGDKRIHAIFPANDRVYLSTGLGVIVLDAERYEVKETWYIGEGGAQVTVNEFARHDGFFYAATDEGLKRAPISGVNHADFAQWENISGSNGLPAGSSEGVLTLGDKMIVRHENTLYNLNGNSWDIFYEDDWTLVNANVSGGVLFLSERMLTGESRVLLLDETGVVQRTLTQVEPISFPMKAIIAGGDPWLADRFGGLTRFYTNSYENFKPNSPESIASGEMTIADNIFYATAGAVNEAWNYQYNGDGIFVLREGTWTNINRYRFPQIDTLLDYITIAIDPSDKSIWAGSYGGGLLHVTGEDQFEIFKQGFIEPAVGDPGSHRVSGLAFDNVGNLWISNFAATQPLVVRKRDGSWNRFTIPFFLFENSLAQIVIDDEDVKWIVAAKSNNLIAFDDNNTIDNTADDRWRSYGPGAGNGNLPEGEVLSIAKDRNGFVWVGTTNGIGVIQCPYDAFLPSGCDATWPVVQQGNFAGYLFNGEEVRSIAVDGADRKWVATANGVFLVSPSGHEVIYHFTESNSPLLSDDVRKIAVDGKSGEVFFATMKGICSFRSTATEGGTKNEDVLVFPNPVPPGFTGTIGIRGLVENAIVKITELNGRLVYQTRALGGQANWDGRDHLGRRVSSGVYLVLVNEEGANGARRKERTAARIVFLK